MDVTTDPSGKSNYVRFIESTEKSVTDQWNFDINASNGINGLVGCGGNARTKNCDTQDIRISSKPIDYLKSILIPVSIVLVTTATKTAKKNCCWP